MRLFLLHVWILLAAKVSGQELMLSALFPDQPASETEVLLVLNSNDCLNCYYSGAQLLSKLPAELVFVLFDNLPPREYKAFLQSKLGIEIPQDRCTTNQALFKEITADYGGTSGIAVFHHGQLMHNNSVRVEHDEVTRLLAPSVGFELYKAVDITHLGGGAQADAQIINDSLFSYYNDIQGVIFLVNRQSGQAVVRLTIPVTKEQYNEWLIIAGLDAEDTVYVHDHPEELQYMATFPARVTTGIPFVGDSFILVPVSILGMDIVPKINGEASSMLKWYSFLCKFDFNGTYIQKWAFPYQVPGQINHFNHLDNMAFMNDSTFWMRASTPNRDSLIISYILPSNSELPVLTGFPDISYPDRFPIKKGPYRKVYYSEWIDREHYFFNKEPVIYSLSDTTSILLPGWNYTPVEKEEENWFWLSSVFEHNGLWYAIGAEKKEMWYAVYSPDYKLIKKEKLLDKPIFDVHFDGSNLAGVTSDDRSVIWYEFRLK